MKHIKFGFLKFVRLVLPKGVPYLISQHFYSSYFFFLLKKKNYIFKKIKQLGFKKIKPYKPSTWKLISKKRVFNRMRFLALDNGNNKIFIKVGYKDLPTLNECNVAKYLFENNIKLNHGLNCLIYDLDNDFSFCAYEFLEGGLNFCDFFKSNDFESGCSAINQALDEFNKYSLVHCDLNNFNFYFTGGKLILLDFGTMKVDGKSLTKNLESKHLGCLYDQNQNFLIYDDAKSIVKRIQAYHYDSNHEDSFEYKKLINKIGENIYQTQLPTT